MDKLRRIFHCSSKLSVLIAILVIACPKTTLSQQETPPPPSAPRSVHFPKPLDRTLHNGLRVIVIERSNMPLVTAQMVVKNGGEADPPQLAGLADMTADLLTKGTTKRTAPEVAEAIEALGGSLDSGAHWDASTAKVSVMSPRFSQALEILADIVRHPTFKEEEIERLRQQNLDELSVELRRPNVLASYVASRLLFGDAPYGHPLKGTPESLARIKRNDIVRMHRTYYRPDNAILVIGGDIKASAAFELAERSFGDWMKPASPWPPANTKAVQTTAENGPPRIVVIDKPDAGQAAVVIAQLGLRRTDEDYFRGLVTNSILGGGYSSRLNQEIRIKRGLSYGAGSKLDVRREAGPFIAVTQTKNETGAEVASLLINELNRLSSEQIAETELIPRKATLIGNFARELETNEDFVGQVAALALYGLNLDEINNYINNVQAVTGSDVQRFAGTHLNAKTAHIIIVGNAQMFLDNLRKQFPNVEVIPEAALDLNSANLHRTGAGATGAKR